METKIFKTTIFRTKIYNNINKCDTIFASLVPFKNDYYWQNYYLKKIVQKMFVFFTDFFFVGNRIFLRRRLPKEMFAKKISPKRFFFSNEWNPECTILEMIKLNQQFFSEK